MQFRLVLTRVNNGWNVRRESSRNSIDWSVVSEFWTGTYPSTTLARYADHPLYHFIVRTA